MSLAALTFMILALFAGSDSDIFRLDTDTTRPEQPERIIVEQPPPDKNFRLEKILTGNFQVPGGANLVLLEKHSDFSTRAEQYFRIRYANLDYDGVRIIHDGITLNGTLRDTVVGDINGNGFDEIILHWIDAIGREWIQVVMESDFANELFAPRRVDANRKEQVTLADINGDGTLEIVVPSFQKTSETIGIDRIVVYFNNDGIVTTESYALIPAPVIDLVVTDTNGDGKDEIVTLRSIEHDQYSQAIWAIERRDDGTYTERPLAMGNAMTLVPPPFLEGRLYYTKKSSPSGRYFNIISTLEFEGERFSNVNECRLLPEGMILEQVWGRFQPGNNESLALIKDESTLARRWLVIYTPYDSDRIVNRIELITNNDFYPNGASAIAIDLNQDGIDEFVYVDTQGRLRMINLVNRTMKTLNVME